MPLKYVRVEGVATLVHHSGPTTLPESPPDLSKGEVVICMHGLGGNGHVFSEVLDELGGSHSPIAFDQPGHGRSGGLDSLGSIERMADFAVALAGKLGVERAVWLGQSLGGMVALEIALTRPGAVRGLVLSATSAKPEVTDEMLDRLRLITEGKARREFDTKRFAKATKPDVYRRAFMEQMKTDPRAAYGDMLAARDFDVEDRLGEIHAPTLVVVGAEEPHAGPDADVLATKIPAATKVVIADAGHAIPLEQPAALAGAVSEFLRFLPE